MASLMQPPGSLGFPNMGQTPPIMAPGQMPTNTGIAPPPAAAPPAAPPVASHAAVGPGGQPNHPHGGLLDRMARFGGGGMSGFQKHFSGLDINALLAKFGGPNGFEHGRHGGIAAPGAPAPVAPAAPASIAAPSAPVLNKPANIIY